MNTLLISDSYKQPSLNPNTVLGAGNRILSGKADSIPEKRTNPTTEYMNLTKNSSDGLSTSRGTYYFRLFWFFGMLFKYP